MKRVIKSSFGYRDSDWVDPDPEMSEADPRAIELKIEDCIVRTDEDGYIEELPESCVYDDDLYDEMDGMKVIDKDAVEEAILDEADKVQDQLKPNTVYVMNGDVEISYNVWVETEYASMRRRYSRNYEPVEYSSDDITDIETYVTLSFVER